MDSTFRLIPLTAIVATLLSLTACQTIPKAKTEPVVAQPHIAINQPYETYDSQTVSGTNQPSIASQRWQDFYSDAKLKQLAHNTKSKTSPMCLLSIVLAHILTVQKIQ